MTDVNYAGQIYTMEAFTSQNSDGSGEITVTLQNTPVDDTAILVFCGNQKRLAEFKSRIGANVTMVIRKMAYDKTNSPITGVLSNLPAGVTEATTLQSPGSSATGVAVNDSSGQQTAPAFHTHSTTISFEYRHNHTPTFAETDLPLAISEANLKVTVGYAF